MKHSSRQQTIAWFQEQYKDGRLELRPPFQRKPVWSSKQRCALIESILMNIPIPEVYVQVEQDDDGTESFGVVDGQQRLRTIVQFIGLEKDEDREDEDDSNNFILGELPPTSVHKDKSFTDLRSVERKALFQYEICVRFIYTSDTREIEDVFKRLNKFLMPLKAQELRNATYHGAFAELSEELADDEYWAVNRLVTPAAIRRMADIEMMSDLLIGLLHGPQGGSARIIDQYYEQYEQYEDEFPEQDRVEKQFAKTRKTIELIFSDGLREVRWGNKADFYSLFVALGGLLEQRELPKSSVKECRKKLIKFAEEVTNRLAEPESQSSPAAQAYARAIEKGSNDKSRRTDRHETLIRVLKPFLREIE